MQIQDRRSLFPEASEQQWGDWRWQMRHSVRSVEQLARLVPLTDDERRGCEETREMFRLGFLAGAQYERSQQPYPSEDWSEDDEAAMHGALAEQLAATDPKLKGT